MFDLRESHFERGGVNLRVKTLKDDDIVYIDSIHGWHYHRKECWMAGLLL